MRRRLWPKLTATVLPVTPCAGELPKGFTPVSAWKGNQDSFLRDGVTSAKLTGPTAYARCNWYDASLHRPQISWV